MFEKTWSELAFAELSFPQRTPVEVNHSIEEKLKTLVGEADAWKPDDYILRLKRLIESKSGDKSTLRVWSNGRDVTGFEFKSEFVDGTYIVSCTVDALRAFIWGKKDELTLFFRKDGRSTAGLVSNRIFNEMNHSPPD